MAKVTEKLKAAAGEVTIICDFSPPRGADTASLEAAKDLAADLICVAYSPGKSVRLDSATTAYWIKEHAQRDVVFNLATRDMNRLALQSHLLGAQLLGLENVIVIMGDPLNERDRTVFKDAADYTATGLIKGIANMNDGVDFRGLKLRTPTRFCIGASIDLSKGMEKEAVLAREKVKAGAQFFITQPIYDPEEARQFEQTFLRLTGEPLSEPVFYGLQVLVKDGIIFGNVPEGLRRDLEQGREGSDIATRLLKEFTNSGLKAIYLVPPILKGGARDYEAAQRVVRASKEKSS